jgi:hypothetical protein
LLLPGGACCHGGHWYGAQSAAVGRHCAVYRV